MSISRNCISISCTYSSRIELKTLGEVFRRDCFVIVQGVLNRDQLEEAVREIGRYIREAAPTIPRNQAIMERG